LNSQPVTLNVSSQELPNENTSEKYFSLINGYKAEIFYELEMIFLINSPRIIRDNSLKLDPFPGSNTTGFVAEN